MPIPEDTARDLARIALQEEQLQFAAFNENSAWQLGSTLHALATARSLSVVIDIRRANQQLFYAALPGTTPDNPEWVRRKSNVTLRLHRSSYAVGLETEAKQSTLYDRYAFSHSDYAGHGGCFPIRVAGTGVVAVVTVSGLPMRADHELVIEALCLELGRDYESLRLANTTA